MDALEVAVSDDLKEWILEEMTRRSTMPHPVATMIRDSMCSMTYTGKLRLHFNRHGAAPLVWSVRTSAWELNVSSVVCNVPMRTVYEPKATPDDEDGKPSAWLECEGTLTVAGSIATVTP